MFTSDETKAIQALKSVSKNTYWGSAVYEFLKSDFTRPEFLTLVRDLQQQNRDCPEVMEKILGAAYKTIVEL